MMGKAKKVTGMVTFGDNDGDWLPISKCICGYAFNYWDFVISAHKDDPNECPNCGAKLYFTVKINVYQVEGDN